MATILQVSPLGWTVAPAVGKTLTQMNLEGNWLVQLLNVNIGVLCCNSASFQGARCEPPSPAQSKCRVEKAFQSNEEKRKWASMCELTWYIVGVAGNEPVCIFTLCSGLANNLQ